MLVLCRRLLEILLQLEEVFLVAQLLEDVRTRSNSDATERSTHRFLLLVLELRVRVVHPIIVHQLRRAHHQLSSPPPTQTKRTLCSLFVTVFRTFFTNS